MSAGQVALHWGVRESFVRYVATMPGGEVSVGGGATMSPRNDFVFPLVDDDQFDWSAANGVLRFGGDLRMVGHHGMLQVTIAHPVLELADGLGRLLIASPTQEDGVFAIVDVQERPSEDGGVRLFSTALVPGAVPFFNDVYPAGLDFADLRLFHTP